MRPVIISYGKNERYQRLVPGAPITGGMKSGCVLLQPGENIGSHVTAGKEELIIVLAGEGELVCEGHGPYPIRQSQVVYVPTDTVHDVRNTGQTALRYIYVTSPVSPPGEMDL